MLKNIANPPIDTTSSEVTFISSPSSNNVILNNNDKNYHFKGETGISGFFLKRDNLLKLARISDLKLTEEEISKYGPQLQETLRYVEEIKSVNTKNIEFTSQVTGLENVTRDDVAKPSLSQDEALSNTKSKHNGFFKVNAIFEE